MIPCDQATEASPFIATMTATHPAPRPQIRLMVFSPLAFGTRPAAGLRPWSASRATRNLTQTLQVAPIVQTAVGHRGLPHKVLDAVGRDLLRAKPVNWRERVTKAARSIVVGRVADPRS